MAPWALAAGVAWKRNILAWLWNLLSSWAAQHSQSHFFVSTVGHVSVTRGESWESEPSHGHSGPFPDRAEHGKTDAWEQFWEGVIHGRVPGDGQGGADTECGEWNVVWRKKSWQIWPKKGPMASTEIHFWRWLGRSETICNVTLKDTCWSWQTMYEEYVWRVHMKSMCESSPSRNTWIEQEQTRFTKKSIKF